MSTEKLSQRIAALRSVSNKDQLELIALMNNLIDGIRAVTAKLDADATVTDTDYTASFDALITKA